MEKMASKRILAGLAAVMVCLVALPGLSLAGHKENIAEVLEDPSSIKEPQDITRLCLNCHEDQATDFMKTSHWNWSLQQQVDGKNVDRGKKNALNNYCTSVAGNEKFCAKCHAGYGMTDAKTFDFSNADNIDCLVCHDTTGTYAKGKNLAGYPAEGINLLRVAENVGKPNRDNCGQCHFFGGGGDAVKHGDLDSSMAYPEKGLDVHMNVDGKDMQCTTCHTTSKHTISGNSLGVSPGGETQFTCTTSCHDIKPHNQSRLDAHLDTVACQTCHIPFIAKEKATKIWWDWSKAGEEREFDEKDEFGHHTYVKKKGEMKYGKMLTPEYRWYNGHAGAYERGAAIDPEEVTQLAYPLGNRKDKSAKIYPFKVMRGKQIYDTEYKNLITAKLVGKGGYWKDFDWFKAADLGSKAADLPFSGKYGFAETEMFWRLNHMVSPKEQALACLDCHGDNGRMEWKALGYKGDPMTKQKWARSN